MDKAAFSDKVLATMNSIADIDSFIRTVVGSINNATGLFYDADGVCIYIYLLGMKCVVFGGIYFHIQSNIIYKVTLIQSNIIYTWICCKYLAEPIVFLFSLPRC